MREVNDAVDNWRSAWTSGQVPELRVYVHGGGYWLHGHTGDTGVPSVQPLSAAAARRLIVSEPYDDSADQRSLIGDKVAVKLDGYSCPSPWPNNRSMRACATLAPASTAHQRRPAGGAPLVLRATA